MKKVEESERKVIMSEQVACQFQSNRERESETMNQDNETNETKMHIFYLSINKLSNKNNTRQPINCNGVSMKVGQQFTIAVYRLT